jgi:O-methyltransferase involved in polyketide biosynthesis
MKNKMTSINQTLYIPLYGKAYVSKRALFLRDPKAEEIWDKEQFPLKGKAKSKWLAYYMGIRSAVFDDWVREKLNEAEDSVVIHIGCGMDSRALRVSGAYTMWYDVDFSEVIGERRRYYEENDRYRMLSGDACDPVWLSDIPQKGKVIVVMEGVSMYLAPASLKKLFEAICAHFEEVSLLTDCYTVLAAKLSKYKNPINDVGVKSVYGTDDPCYPQAGGLFYLGERDMTPLRYIDELRGTEKRIFRKLYAGAFAKKLYRLYEYEKKCFSRNVENGEK